VEPIGTIVGPRGSRINLIQDQIHREHIEVIEYTDDFTRYIVNVCSPAEIAGVAIIEPATPDKRRQIILVAKGDKLALLIGKKGTNVRLISEMLKADVEIRTIEDAHAGNLEYQHIDMQSLRQQTFNSSYNKYRVRGDVLSGFEKGRSSFNRRSDKNFSNNRNVGDVKNKKEKSSILSDFQGMNKEDLLNELSNVNSSDDIASDIVDNYDEYNNK
jgi:transcription antitermination factor NusA-like protein